MVVGYESFCFPQGCKPPLNFEIFITSDAFYNSAFFYQQFEFAWLCVMSLLGRVAKSMRPVGTQSRFTTPWWGDFCQFFQPIHVGALIISFSFLHLANPPSTPALAKALVEFSVE